MRPGDIKPKALDASTDWLDIVRTTGIFLENRVTGDDHYLARYLALRPGIASPINVKPRVRRWSAHPG